MTRFERISVWSTSLLVAATGVAYGWMKYLLPAGDPFSVINHPLQPLFLKLHILVAPLFLLAIGMVAVRHIWRHFRSGTRRARRTGIAAALGLAPMVGTGYLIQVLTGEALLLAMIISHIGFGLLYVVGLALHQWLLTRSSSGRKRERRGATRPEASKRPDPRPDRGATRGPGPEIATGRGAGERPVGSRPRASRPPDPIPS